MNQPWLTTSDCPVSAFELEGGEEQRRLGDILDGGEFAVDRVLQHHLLDHRVFRDAELLGLFGDLLVDQRRADEAGTDDVGADAVLGAFLGDHLGEADEAMLGGDVGRLQHRGLFRMHRSHIDDAAAGALLVHLPQRGARRQEGAVEMDGEKLLPFGEGKVIERRHDLDAGIAHQDVDPAESRDCLGHAGLDLRLIGHVHGDADRAAGAAELGRRGIGALLVEIGNDDLGALARICPGDLLADAARGTGDNGNLVLEAHGFLPWG